MAEERMARDSLRVLIKTDLLFKDVPNHDQFIQDLQKLFTPLSVEPQQMVYEYGQDSQTMYFVGEFTLETTTVYGYIYIY